MGIMDRLRKKDEAGAGENGAGAAVAERPEGIPLSENRETPVLAITDGAKAKIRAVLGSQEPAVDTIRVSASGPGRYSMQLEPEGKPAVDDTILPYEGFQVFVDAQSLPLVDGAELTWVDTYGGGGFQFTKAGPPPPQRKQAPEGETGELWRQIEQLLDEEVNPMVASHGGHITLMEVKDHTVFVEMGGGCQGCGMAKVTLKQGVERMIKDRFPEIEEVLDVTDHAGGRNPYYAGSY